MLDKIVLSSCRKMATMIFTDREPVVISSDKNVEPLLMWFLDFPQAKLITENETVTGIEITKPDDEITMKITVGAA